MFIKEPNIIKDQLNFKYLIEELKNLLISGNNIILPFLEIFPIIIKTYIESDLDEEEKLDKSIYLEIFQLLKINCFINREYLYPIYEYFSQIFYNINNNEDINNIKLKKFKKVLELLKILYDFDKTENSSKILSHESSYCFIGGSLKVELSNEIILNNSCFIIKINILKNFSKFNENCILFRIDDEIPFELQFSSITNLTKDKIKLILITFRLNIIEIKVEMEDDNLKPYENKINTNINKIKNFYLLENFYGQIKSFEINNKTNKNENIDNNNEIILFDEIFEPYPLSDDGILYHRKNNYQKSEKEELEDLINIQENSKISINIIDNNLVKVNYINYLDENFDLIEYFRGFTPFIPFIPLINGIYKNPNIKIINGIDKKIFLNDIFDDILYLICKNLKKINSKDIKKYFLFVFSLIFQLDYQIYEKGIEKKKIKEVTTTDKIINIIPNLDVNSNMISYIFGKLVNKEINQFDSYMIKEKELFSKKLKKDYSDDKNNILIKSSYKQLYRSLMKELFIYNRFWSKKELFFEKKNNRDNKTEDTLRIKYKQISYYTQSFQQPLLYPILEIKEYFPSFSRFEVEKMFDHEFKYIAKYNFNFNKNIISKIVEENNPLYNEENKIKCCLIKKIYHVKGVLFIIKRKTERKKNIFEIVFCSDNDNKGQTCNKNIENINNDNSNKKISDINSNNNSICYGALFPFPQKEFNRKIYIKSNDIKFLLVRNYFRKTSAIEIFTYKSNKSYYFNFLENINLKDKTNNILLKEVINNNSFVKLELDNQKVYYNQKYKGIMFPLFFKNFPTWKKKLKYYNNYDLITIINLLSNRSFKDLYQYPIFPILYKSNKILDKQINKERDLSQHMGMQELNDKCKERKKLIEETYIASLEEKENYGNDDEETPCLFNTHYSNPVYVSNYLIRIFPYSLVAIELQGDGFDTPNRLFYSIKKTMENTLSQKSDLREFIPELYYLPDLFTNNNELKLGTLSDGAKIDSISIYDKIKNKEEESYKIYEFISNSKKYLEFYNLELNKWLDLIFGINQRQTNDKKVYFGNEIYIHFDDEPQKNDINIDLMQRLEFGIQPFQLLNSKFPDLKNKSKYFETIKEYNIKQFEKEHFIIKGDKNKCFKYEAFINKNPEYLEILKHHVFIKQRAINESDFEKYFKDEKTIIFFYYIFIGDVLGNITVYERKLKKEQNKKENNQNNFKFDLVSVQETESNDFETIFCYDKFDSKNKYKKIIKLTDHNKQIKYIDYNPRLNLFLSYSLDGFINIYVFPKCKLVRTIKVCNITNSNDILQKVVLVSNPFPMIFTYDKDNMYLFTLNGELINFKKLEKDIDIYPCIDKNCGLINDFILLKHLNEKEDSKKINEEIVFPSLHKH